MDQSEGEVYRNRVFISEYLWKAAKSILLTSKSARLMISTPLSCPRLTSSVSNGSISTMVLIVFPFPFTQSRMVWAFCVTSQIMVEMEPGDKWATMLKGNWTEPLGVTVLWLVWVCAGGTVHVEVPLLCTFIDDVADGLCTEGVIERNHHQGVRVTGQLRYGPLAQRRQSMRKLKSINQTEQKNQQIQ